MRTVHKIKKLFLATVGVVVLQSGLVVLHRQLPGHQKFSEIAEDRGVDMNALFYSEERLTSEAYLKLNEKLSGNHRTVRQDDIDLND